MSGLISRQAALDALNRKKIYRQLDSDRWVISDCLNAIVNLPSAEPERKTGRWIESDNPNEKYVCSVCGGACWYYDTQKDVAKSRYCPNCGSYNGGECK